MKGEQKLGSFDELGGIPNTSVEKKGGIGGAGENSKEKNPEKTTEDNDQEKINKKPGDTTPAPVGFKNKGNRKSPIIGTVSHIGTPDSFNYTPESRIKGKTTETPARKDTSLIFKKTELRVNPSGKKKLFDGTFEKAGKPQIKKTRVGEPVASKTPIRKPNLITYTPAQYKESPEATEYFKKKDQEKKSKLQQKANKLVSTVFPEISKDELEKIDASHAKKLEKQEEAKMLREAQKMVRNISQKSIEVPTPQFSKIVWPVEGRRITDKEYTKPTPSKNTIFPIKNAQRPSDNKKESSPAPIVAPEKSKAEQFLENQIASLLKGGMSEQNATILMLKNELKKEQEKNTPTTEPANKIVQEKTTTPRALKPRTLPQKPLNETLDEIEKNARDSIKKTSEEKIEKALEGNQEEIANLTLRINQFNTIQEKIKELKEKRRLLTESTDMSYDQKLVDQIDEEIQKVESLSPYKSKEEEEKIADTQEAESENNSSTKTVNESYANEEKNINDTFAPTEKSVADAYIDGTLNTQEKNSDEKDEVLNEIPKSPELLALESARKEYAEKQKAFLDNHRKTQNSINKIRDFFGFGKKIKEEQLPEELKNLKTAYDQKKVEYGKSLIRQHILEIENKIQKGELEDQDKETALEQFIKGNIFDEVIVKERESLLALQAETLPAKEKGVFKKALDGYLKLKSWQRTVISSTLITGVIATTGAFASAGAVGGYLGTKIAKGVVSVYAGKTIGGKVDSFFEKDFGKSLSRMEKNARYDLVDFNPEDFDKALSLAEKAYESKNKLEQDSKRIRIVTKGVISLIAGLGVSDFIGREIIPNISSLDQSIPDHDSTLKTPPEKISSDTPITPSTPKIPAESIKPISDTLSTQAPKEAVSFSGESSFKAPEAPHDTVTVNQPTPEPSQPKISEPISTPKPEAPLSSRTETISVEADKLGAIETFKDLKEKLVASYPDPKLAPANVREILEGDPTALATKYGFYNPSQGAESALMHKGEQLGFDTKGNLYFKDANGTVDYLSEQKGFDGKMIDTDHVQKTSAPQEIPKSINPNDTTTYSDNTQKIESVDPNDYTNNSSITENNTANLKSVNPNEDVGFRQNTFYTKDPEIDAMTPTRPQELPQQEVTAKEFVESLNTKEIHSLAEQEFNKDINSMFQKPNFLLGGSTPGMKTEEWAKTLSFIENNKVTGNHLFEALETGKLQNSDQGEFFTLGEYARSLRTETGLAPREGELLKDYFIRANEYKVTNHITDKEVGDMLYGKDDSSEPRISEETRQKINARARRSVETDGVYN